MTYLYLLWDFLLLALFLCITGTGALDPDVSFEWYTFVFVLGVSVLQAIFMTLRFVKK